MVVDLVMQQSKAGKKISIKWILTKQLEDPNFEIRNQPNLTQAARRAREALLITEEAARTGFKINIGRTKHMRVNTRQQDQVQLHKENIIEVNKFVLGSIFGKDGQTKISRTC